MLVNIVVTAKYGIGTRMFGRCRMGVDVWIEDVKGFVLIKTACVALNEAEFNRNLFISPRKSIPPLPLKTLDSSSTPSLQHLLHPVTTFEPLLSSPPNMKHKPGPLHTLQTLLHLLSYVKVL
jgi:hypothetical protein